MWHGVFEGGIRYLGGTLESYGNINTSDSLTAIKELVFDRKLITPGQLANALDKNFAEQEDIRRLLLLAPKYGNDDDEADRMAVRLHNDICCMVREFNTKAGLHSYLAVIINNSMNTTFGLTTGASADGRLAYTYMANANNPMGGMDKSGITAMLNSLVKLKTDEHAGSVQNMRFSTEMFTKLLDKTKNLLEVYFSDGGSQAMITVLSRGNLEEAMIMPEK
ncbi:MAG: pyruvate formate lyase family protein [Anaerocolumna sp.]